MEASASERARVTQYVDPAASAEVPAADAGGWFTVAGVDEGSEPVEAGSSDAAIQDYLDNRSTLDEDELVGAEFVAGPDSLVEAAQARRHRRGPGQAAVQAGLMADDLSRLEDRRNRQRRAALRRSAEVRARRKELTRQAARG